MMVQTDSRARAAVAQARARAARLVGRPVDAPTSCGRCCASTAPIPARFGAGGRDRGAAGQGRQRPLRARLLEVRALLQVRRGLRHRRAEHLRDRRRRARLRRAHLDRVRRAAARLGVRLLRQLHRRLPDRRADGQAASSSCAQAGEWAPGAQTVTDTICPYCGVGCTLTAARAGRADRQGRPRRSRTRRPTATCASRAASGSNTRTNRNRD